MLCSNRATEAGRKSRTNDLWRCCSPASFLTSPVVDSHGRRGPPLLTAVSPLLWCMLPVFAAVCIRKTTGPRRGMRWWWPRRGPPVNYCRTLFFEEDSEKEKLAEWVGVIRKPDSCLGTDQRQRDQTQNNRADNIICFYFLFDLTFKTLNIARKKTNLTVVVTSKPNLIAECII